VFERDVNEETRWDRTVQIISGATEAAAGVVAVAVAELVTTVLEGISEISCDGNWPRKLGWAR
jgi:hypothetical protein